MYETQPRITRISEQALPDANGLPKRFIVVEYMVGDHGPFTEQFLKDTYTPAAAKATLAQKAQAIKDLTY